MSLHDANLLVVDDEPALRHLLSKWLSALGCSNVHVAENGEAALKFLRRGPVDLVLTDVSMPVMDGVGLVHCIAKTSIFVPSIVFLSGYADVDRREMHGLGVEAFVTKPFEYSELERVLQNSLAHRSTLWAEKMPTAPRQDMSIIVKRLAERAAEGSVCLGRGGFSAVSSSPLSLGRLSFQCIFEDGSREITGQGYVRWKSTIDRSVGIEFSHLDPCCRSWLSKQITETHPRCFIPAV